jgi:tetratricopeptide (TPR) repeat protein
LSRPRRTQVDNSKTHRESERQQLVEITGATRAEALLGEADALRAIGRIDDALEIYAQILACPAEASHDDIHTLLSRTFAKKASALVQLGRFDAANVTTAELRTWASGNPKSELLLSQLLAEFVAEFHSTVGILFREGRDEETIVAADALIEGFLDEPPRRLDFVLHTAFLKASAIARLGDTEQGIRLLHALVDRYGDDTDSMVRKVVALAIDKQVKLLLGSGRQEEAMEASDELLARCGEEPDPVIRELAASALQGKFFALRNASRHEEAIAVADETIRRFSHEPPPGMPYAAVAALIEKAWLLPRVGRAREAIVAVDSMLERYEAATAAPLQVHIARALCAKAAALGALGDWAAAVNVDERVAQRFANVIDPELGEPLARALFQRARGLMELGMTDASITAWNDVIDRYGDTRGSAVREMVATARAEKGELLGLTGKFDEAIAVGQELVARAGDQTPVLANGLGIVTAALVAKGCYDEALDVLDTLLVRLAAVTQPSLRAKVAEALNNKASVLALLNRLAESESVREHLVTCFGDEILNVFDEYARRCERVPGLYAREQLASTLYGKASVLTDLGRRDDAIAVLTALITRFGEDSDPAIVAAVSRARELGRFGSERIAETD